MRERMVVCGGLQAPRGSPTDTLKLDVNASAGSPVQAPGKQERKVNLHLGDLFRPMADNIPDVLSRRGRRRADWKQQESRAG
jgi:hypothetical protein